MKKILLFLGVLILTLGLTVGICDATLHVVRDANSIDYVDELGVSIFTIDHNAGVTFTGTVTSTDHILMPTTYRVQFYGTNQYIGATGATALTIVTDGTFTLTAPTSVVTATTSHTLTTPTSGIVASTSHTITTPTFTHKLDASNYVTQTIGATGLVTVTTTGGTGGAYKIVADDTTITLDANTAIALIADTGTFDFVAAGLQMNTLTITECGDILANEAVGPAFLNETASSINPTLCPNRGDKTLGLGWSSGVIHVVVSGADAYDFSSTAFTLASGNNLVITQGIIDLSNAATENAVIKLKDAVADALSITRNNTDMILFETTTPRITITPTITVTGDIICDSTTEGTASEGSIQTDGGLNVAKKSFFLDDVDVADGKKIFFKASTEYIYSSGTGQVDIDAASVVDIVAPTINITATTVTAFTYPVTVTMAAVAGDLLGVTSTVTMSTDVAGSIAGFFGKAYLSQSSGSAAKNAFGGCFEMKFQTGYNATGHGLTVGAYVGAYSDVAEGTPTACLFVEAIPGTLADFSTNMAILVLTDSGAGVGPNIAIEFGSAPAGKTVTSTIGTMYYEETIQVKVNANARYIPLLDAQVNINDPSSKYVIYVNKNTTCAAGDQNGTFYRPYAEIQTAVARVITLADNTDALAYTIMVAPGTYTTKIDLDSLELFNLSIIATGAPRSVIVNVTDTGNAFECDANNANLKRLYVKGIDFYDPIALTGADNNTEFLRYQGIFEDCLLSNGGTDDPHTGKTMLTVVNAGRFFWHGGSIHVLDTIVITNVLTSGIRGENYRDRFAEVGAPGTTTITNVSGNKPIGFAGGTMTYYIIGAYVQRWEPSLVTTDGVVRYWLRNAYSGLAMGLTIPSNGHFYMHNSVQPGNVALVSGCAVKLYKSHVRGTITGTCGDYTNYGSTKGTGLTAATIG